MKYKIISSKLNLPINISILYNEKLYKEFNKYPKLFLNLGENLTIETENSTYTLNYEEMFFINNNSIYSTNIPNSPVIEFTIDTNYFSVYSPSFNNIIFDKTPLEFDKYGENLFILKENIKTILRSCSNINLENSLNLLQLMISFADFIRPFSNTNNDHVYISDENIDYKVKFIIDYIDTNYSNKINLDIMSKELGINSQYLSRLFKQVFGIGFLNYLNSTRIKKSLKSLLYTNESILEIAINSGFNDSKNYTRAFKKEFSLTPGEYRKKRYLLSESMEYIDLVNNNILFEKLNNFINNSENSVNFNKIHTPNLNSSIISVLDTHISKNIQLKIFSVERAYSILEYTLQEQIKFSHKEFSFNYLKFAGIFNEEMRIYNEEDSGEVIYNWNNLDRILDFLINLKIIPFINIGYMPEQLASDKKYIFYYRANVSFPKSMDKWKSLVKNFILHVIERYGYDEVKKWYFEIWNNPNIEGMYWCESSNKYFDFFKESFLTIKNLIPEVNIGGPSISVDSSSIYIEPLKKWIIDFIDFMNSQNIKFDFFSIHSFSISFNEDINCIEKKLNYKTFKDLKKLPTRNIDYMKKDIIYTKNILRSKSIDHIPLIISEWNIKPYLNSEVNDSCALATAIVYNTLSNQHRVKAMIYWTLSDIFEEYGHPKKIFNGHFGLLTNNGLKKASYNAFFLLNKLGDLIIKKGDGYIITKFSNSDKFQVLLYNYIYPNNSKDNFDIFNMQDNLENKFFNIKLIDIKKGKYKIKKWFLNKNSGSVYDSYLKLGEPDSIDHDTFSFLKSKEQMDLFISHEHIDSSYSISETLEPNSILFIEINE